MDNKDIFDVTYDELLNLNLYEVIGEGLEMIDARHRQAINPDAEKQLMQQLKVLKCFCIDDLVGLCLYIQRNKKEKLSSVYGKMVTKGV